MIKQESRWRMPNSMTASRSVLGQNSLLSKLPSSDPSQPKSDLRLILNPYKRNYEDQFMREGESATKTRFFSPPRTQQRQERGFFSPDLKRSGSRAGFSQMKFGSTMGKFREGGERNQHHQSRFQMTGSIFLQRKEKQVSLKQSQFKPRTEAKPELRFNHLEAKENYSRGVGWSKGPYQMGSSQHNFQAYQRMPAGQDWEQCRRGARGDDRVFSRPDYQDYNRGNPMAEGRFQQPLSGQQTSGLVSRRAYDGRNRRDNSYQDGGFRGFQKNYGHGPPFAGPAPYQERSRDHYQQRSYEEDFQRPHFDRQMPLQPTQPRGGSDYQTSHQDYSQWDYQSRGYDDRRQPAWQQGHRPAQEWQPPYQSGFQPRTPRPQWQSSFRKGTVAQTSMDRDPYERARGMPHYPEYQGGRGGPSYDGRGGIHPQWQPPVPKEQVKQEWHGRQYEGSSGGGPGDWQHPPHYPQFKEQEGGGHPFMGGPLMGFGFGQPMMWGWGEGQPKGGQGQQEGGGRHEY